MPTNVERLQEAGLLRENTNLSQEYQDKINELTPGDIKCLIDVAEKLGLDGKPILEHGVQLCGF